MKPIYLRNIPPPTETFNHTEFLELLCKWLKPESYLEMGVRWAENFNRLSKLSIKAIGVDINQCPVQVSDNVKFYLEDTDTFIKKCNERNLKFDLVFIDADHSFEQSLKDFIGISEYVIDDGFIILHDTYPYNEELLQPHFSNDVYKTALYIKNNLSDNFEILTLPFNPGLTLIKKINKNKQMTWL
jgi:predicted O-methyltransferase YrrM